MGETATGPSWRFAVSPFPFSSLPAQNRRVPIGFLQAPRAGVFEKFVNRHQHHAWTFHAQAQTEIEFVVQKMNIAVAEHAEEQASSFEIVGMNNAILDLEGRGRCARVA